ncbi:hypothetical protein [Reichenbachiella sp. MALMAid0571]|uniref:hypothetical protein n=1 Tax=Reichenbachiella sp. MALMAid0571 TaxID=3143939 RepID=UPI0032DE575E
MLGKLKRVLVIVGSVAAMSMWACTEEEPTIGLQFINEASFELASWDTLTMKMSTVMLDSFVTSSASRLLAGSYIDSDFGMVNPCPYFRFTANVSHKDEDPDLLKYNYTVLRLYYDGYYLNDTTQFQTLRVFELAEEMEQENDDGDTQLYNTSEFSIKYENGIDSPLGELTFIPHPTKSIDGGSGYIEIELPDRLGKQIFDITYNDDLEEYPDFTDIIHGFKIESDENNTAILGFTTAVEFRINYTDYAAIPYQEKELTFTVEGTNDYFNHVEADKENTLTQSIIESDNDLPSDQSDNMVYLMAGARMALRIELPYLREILYDNPAIAIDEVLLSLRPMIDRYKNGNKKMPGTLQGTIVDKDNEAISTSTFTAYLYEDDEFDRDTQYLVDINDFVQLQLGILEENENALLFVPSTNSFTESMDNLVIADSNNDEFNTYIMLNLIKIKNE